MVQPLDSKQVQPTLCRQNIGSSMLSWSLMSLTPPRQKSFSAAACLTVPASSFGLCICGSSRRCDLAIHFAPCQASVLLTPTPPTKQTTSFGSQKSRALQHIILLTVLPSPVYLLHKSLLMQTQSHLVPTALDFPHKLHTLQA